MIAKMINLRFLLMGLMLASGTDAKAAESLEAGMKDVATALAQSLSESGLKKLAVVEFTDLNGYRSALGPFLAEELTSQLFQAKPGAFDFVERQQLIKVLEEQKLSSASIFDQSSIADVGKILGIQGLITGTISSLGDDVKIHTKVISVDSARIVASVATRFPQKGDVESLMRQGTGIPRPSGPPVQEGTQPADVYFRNDRVEILVDRIGADPQGNTITISLLVKNITSHDLQLALAYGAYPFTAYGRDSKSASLIGPGGVTYSFDRILSGITAARAAASAGDFVSISPQGRTIVVLRLKSNSPNFQRPTSGSYTFSTMFRSWENGKIATFAVGISGIQLVVQDPG